MSKRILVIGGGSAGVGAAYRAALCGAAVTLIEADGCLGGASTLGGVNCHEPGIASLGLNRVLYEHLKGMENAVGIGRTTRPYTRESNAGFNEIIPGIPYEATLRRGDLKPLQVARVHFEPLAMAEAMRETLVSAGVKLLLNTRFRSALISGGRVTGAVLEDAGGERFTLPCDAIIDCTADANVFRSLGIKTYFGEDACSAFGEPSAPDVPKPIVNGVSLCFRVAPGDTGNEAPAWVYDTEAADWIRSTPLPAANVNAYPNGDLNYNPLPLMEGAEYHALPEEKRMSVLTARLYLYWEKMKREHGHSGHIVSVFPRAGVRESYRCDTLTMLTENEMRRGCASQGDDIIALADHVLDTHGARSKKLSLPSALHDPYGVPMGSLIAKDYGNLLVAGRCAGFTHVAASSCRLTRTMMDIGEAAGAIASLSSDAREVNAAKVREALNFGKYLDWVQKEYYKIGE